MHNVLLALNITDLVELTQSRLCWKETCFSMCGIIGAVDFANHPIDVTAIRTGMQRLAHRGPDGEGLFLWRPYSGTSHVLFSSDSMHELDPDYGAIVALGHRRLAIIDLAGGSQPLSNEDESVWVTYNGEIYNYIELRDELEQAGHRFKTQSDTEVIVHAYEEWGEACPTRFNGIFAYAIWDVRKRRLILARDHLGVKPLYHTWMGSTFLFASEIKALLTYPGMTVQPYVSAIASYWQQGFCPGRETFFQGVYKLPPAHYMEVAAPGSASPQSYWRLPEPNLEISLDEAIERLGVLLSDAVRLQLRSDVEVGAHLSGGIDSSLVVALASLHMKQPIETFTGCWVPDTPQDERHYARAVSEMYHTEQHEIVLSQEAPNYAGTLRRMIWFLDEPVAGPGVIPQYWVSHLCSRYVKVVLGGQGGDELFGGYRSFLPALVQSRLLDTMRSPSIASVQALTQALMAFVGWLKPQEVRRAIRRRLHDSRIDWLTPDYAAALCSNESTNAKVSGLNPFDRATRDLVTGYLVSLLQIEDRTSMAVSVESRVPLLDYRVVELAVSMPYSLKTRERETKLVVRHLAKKWLPQIVLTRTDKIGFTPPSEFWYGESMRQVAVRALDQKIIQARAVINPEAAARVRRAYEAQDNSFLKRLWRIISLDLWFRIFVENEKEDGDAS